MALTVKGSPINAVQTANANILLGVAKQQNAGAIASQAIICAAILENGLETGSNGTYWGVLSGAISQWPNQNDTAGMALAFFTGLGPQKQTDFSSALALVREGETGPMTVAEKAEGVFGTGQYESETGFSGVPAEAKAIVAALGGGTVAGGVAGSGGSGTAADGSAASTYKFVIGTTANPDEDFWTGVNRLAQEVNWYLFSNGENMYYMDGGSCSPRPPPCTWIGSLTQTGS